MNVSHVSSVGDTAMPMWFVYSVLLTFHILIRSVSTTLLSVIVHADIARYRGLFHPFLMFIVHVKIRIIWDMSDISSSTLTFRRCDGIGKLHIL